MKGVGLKGFFVPFGIVVGIAAFGLVLVRWEIGPSDSLLQTGESTHPPDEHMDGLPVGSLVPDLALKPFGKGAPVRLSHLLRDRKVLYSFMGEKDWNSPEFQARVSRWLAGEGAGK